MTQAHINQSQQPTQQPDWDRVARLMGQETLNQLAGKRVAIVGLGSGGGFVALSLAMSGVGRFVLIDDDSLEQTNVVRHVADLRDVGRPKVDAVADLIRDRNPNAQVETVVGKLESHAERLHGVDLVIVGVDGELVKYEINSVCRRQGLTAVYAGVYERGEGGDVAVIHASGDGPCYACWARQLREDVASANARESVDPAENDLDYGMIGPDGTIEAEPGLWLHVARVAGVQAEIALNELLIGQPMHRVYPANTVVLANVAIEIFEGLTVPPFSAQWINVTRDPQCMVCGTPDSSALSLSALAGDLIESEDEDEGETSESLHSARQEE